MALKIKFTRIVFDLNAAGDATAQAYFMARDDAAVGKLQGGVSDSIQFDPQLTGAQKTALRQKAIDAIKTIYTGADEE